MNQKKMFDGPAFAVATVTNIAIGIGAVFYIFSTIPASGGLLILFLPIFGFLVFAGLEIVNLFGFVILYFFNWKYKIALLPFIIILILFIVSLLPIGKGKLGYSFLLSLSVLPVFIFEILRLIKNESNRLKVIFFFTVAFIISSALAGILSTVE